MNNENPEPLAETSVSSPEREEPKNHELLQLLLQSKHIGGQDRLQWEGRVRRIMAWLADHPEALDPSSLSTEPETARDEMRLIFGVAYTYDPGKNSPRLREAYGRVAARLNITADQMKQFRDDVTTARDCTN